MSKWPYPPEPKPGPWQTRRVGPVVLRYRQKNRYEVESRNLRRRWDVLKEHFGRETGLYRFVAWLARRVGE